MVLVRHVQAVDGLEPREAEGKGGVLQGDPEVCGGEETDRCFQEGRGL